MTAKTRYDFLASYRENFLSTAIECAELTIPHLIQEDQYRARGNHLKLKTPWQSVGAKGVVTLASKLMLALLPPQTSFFKLQMNDSKLGEDIPPEIRSELDSSFSKMERQVMESIAASSDRVIVHQAIKHLVVGGNGVLYTPKDVNMQFFPLNRYVVDRDGNGTWVELIIKELISKELLEAEGYIADEDSYRKERREASEPDDDQEGTDDEDVEVYTHVRRVDHKHVWHQEIDGKVVKGSRMSSPVDTSPWIVLRFNVVDGESYGRGRVEEFLGDLKSLDALSQAMVEGSAIAAKVIYLLNPGSTVKPATVAAAPNGGVILGKEGDLVPVQVGKAMDFRTAQEMIVQLTQRISEAFLVMNVRNSERTTAEEVRMTQLELEQQLGGLFSLLTVEFLVPYLNRKLHVLQKNQDIQKIPKDLVRPTIVAGINALGRGQDAESLTRFVGTVAQVFGPEALQKFVDPLEAIKRLAAAQGIDILNLVRTPQQVEQQVAQAMGMQKEMSLVDQTAALASSPLMDPSKNPQLANGESSPNQAGQEQAAVPTPA
jgi:hypothetical protein